MPSARPRDVAVDDGDHPGRGATAPGRSAWWEALVAALAAGVLFLLGLDGGLRRLLTPLGDGDMLPAYAAARGWAQGSPYGDPSLGFPFGMEMRYYPTADVLQNAAAGLATWATGNPFLGLNLVFAASFPLTAAAAVWVLRIAGLRGPFAVLAALALTFIPYHWYRVEHIHLGTMYSAVLGVGLALLVGNGTVDRRLRSASRLRFALLLLALVVAIAASGIYYACFTIVLCAVAWLYRAVLAREWVGPLLAATPAVALVLALIAVLAPSIVHTWQNPPLEAIADRAEVESVQYAGALLFTLLPAPVSRVPGFGPVNALIRDAYEVGDDYIWSGVVWYADFGSLATTTALAVIVVGGVVLARRAALLRERALAGEADAARALATPRPPEPVPLGLVALLAGTIVAFFIPWGLNYVFAYLVTPQLRAWDRWVPMLFTVVLIAAGLVLQRLRIRLSRGGTVGVAAIAALLLVSDSVLPYRSVLGATADDAAAYSGAGYEYAAVLNTAVPGRCGVLQLPYFGFPEEPPRHGMGNYEHLWTALTNPGKYWSFGAVKGTLDSAWQRTLGDAIDAEDVALLRAGGFCAVHVDRRGYPADAADALVADLQELLGPPVAVGLGGSWISFAVPGAPSAADAADLLDGPGDVATFYAPPRIAPVRGAIAAPDPGAPDPAWLLPPGEAAFDVTALDGGPEFAGVRGALLTGPCADGEVLLTLGTGPDVVRQSVAVAPDEEVPFSITLERPTRSAELSLTVPSCGETGDTGSVRLIDPRAEG